MMNNMMRKEFHLIKNPLMLLSFLKEVNKGKQDLMKVEGESLTLEFRINKIVDSATVVGGYWINTIEILEMIRQVEYYDLTELIDANLMYIAGKTVLGKGYEDELWYDVVFKLYKEQMVQLPNQISVN